MKKILDQALEAFMWVFGIFMYSLALPLFLGIVWAFGEVYPWFMNFSWTIKIPICIVVGICLKNWINKSSLKNKQKRKNNIVAEF